MSLIVWCLIFMYLYIELSFCISRTDGNYICEYIVDNEMQCPVENDVIVIHLNPLEILIDCPPDLQKLESLHLPSITKESKQLHFRFCPAPKKSFLSILNILPDEIQYFEFSDASIKNLTLDNYHFKGFSTVVELHLSENGITNLNGDIFSETPNVQELELGSNNIVLKSNLFNNIPLLETLDLSNNKLIDLPLGVFKPLKKLKKLYLWRNKLTKIDEWVFDGLDSLQTLELSFNKIKIISENAFKNFKHLEEINLSSNKLRKLPPKLFYSNRNLKTVDMRHNFKLQIPDYFFANSSLTKVDLRNCKLKTVPLHVFENSQFLKIIKLEENELTCLPETLFNGLHNLEEIYLQKNKIQIISKVFHGLWRLRILQLQYNAISFLAPEVFRNIKSLTYLNLGNNKINKINAKLFSHKNNITRINFSHNSIKTPLDQIINLDSVPNLSFLDLKHNQISSLKLKKLSAVNHLRINIDFNKIKIIDFQDVNLNSNLTISMKNNSLQCGCENYKLFEYLQTREKKLCKLEIETGEICKNQIYSLELITCSLKKLKKNYTECPWNCSCGWRPADKSLVFDCSRKNLTSYPEIDLSHIDFINFRQTELNMTGNNLKNGPTNYSYFENVTKLYLSYNKLESFNWMPSKVEVLFIDNNKLKNLNENILNKLNQTKSLKLSLHNNPWFCSCNSLPLVKFLSQRGKSLMKSDLFCSNTKNHLLSLKQADICFELKPINLLLIFLSVLLTLAITFALYYRHQKLIKMWLFNKNLCLWWVTEEELDKDKTYDVFISYSHKDEEFIVKNLVPVLEKSEYTLCLHYRNWIPGEFITKQIVNSVTMSRRTLVVLSNNFLESVWGKMEFRMAHSQAMNDGRTRVIIVLYGDVDVDDLDDELKLYLQTNTYLKWSDPYFWSKLKFALPHKKQTYARIKKYKRQNIASSCDKCELIQSTTDLRKTSV